MPQRRDGTFVYTCALAQGSRRSFAHAGSASRPKPRTVRRRVLRTAKPSKTAPATKQAPRARKSNPAESFFASFSPAAAATAAEDAKGITPATPKDALAAAPAKPRASRENSTQARVLAMLSTPEGATLDAIMSATGWQAHTVRGFVSGTAKKKLGLTIESLRVDGKRTYRLAA